MTVIVLSLVGLMVLIATVAPPDRGTRGGSGAQAVPAPTAPLTDPDAFDVSAELSTAARKPKTIEAEIGDRVQLTVDGSKLDTVAVGELSMKGVEPGVPARFELLADAAGAYPVVLVNANRRIGTLEIR